MRKSIPGAHGSPLHGRRSLSIVGGLLLCVSLTAAAQPPLTRGSLEKRLERIGRLAEEGRWPRVDREAARLADELRAALISAGGTGDESSQLLAMLLTLRALAASAEARHEDAVWHWSLAQSLWPDLTRATLSSYGEPAAFLRENRLDLDGMGCCGREECSDGDGGDGAVRAIEEGAGAEPPGEVEPPVKIEAPLPQYPFGARTAGLEGAVFVLAIIGKDGRIRQAILPGYPSVAMAMAAVEPLRRWRFEPARLDGVPVDVYYCLRVNFALR